MTSKENVLYRVGIMLMTVKTMACLGAVAWLVSMLSGCSSQTPEETIAKMQGIEPNGVLDDDAE
ncbi:MAG: hypothetical protein LBU35_03000 [Holosporales bacterium]|jgi:hypothetical protein|nr:hypothetical protein [Holosporales bacterium]